MKQIDTIRGYHAHVYFDAQSVEKARTLCETTATLFGVKINYYGYIKGFLGTTEVKSIAKSYASVSMIARLLWQTLKLTPKIRRTAKAMHKKWPWDPPEGSLDRPLAELRQEYGIILFRPETELGLDPATV
ncbi:MAG: hypothetical protein ACPG77_07295 [Nannocystaceae bacterium]